MRYEEQILKFNEYTIAFLSDTSCVITKDIDKALTYETMHPIDLKKLTRNSKHSIGLDRFYFDVKNKVVYLFINDKKYTIEQLYNMAYDFQSVDLKIKARYLIYKKGNNVFVALPDGDFTYLNRNNVMLKKFLGNITYFGNMNKNEVIEKCKLLMKYDVPISSIITDNVIFEEGELNLIQSTVRNDLSPSNSFYFVDKYDLNISNTGAKPVLTYGFSKNNMLNYFDINSSNNYAELREYVLGDFNYNKHYFNKTNITSSTSEYLCRLVQFNCFIPIMFFNFSKVDTANLTYNNRYFNAVIKYSKLRHRLIPFLYSVFKSKRLFYKDVYKKVNDQLLVADTFFLSCVVSDIDKTINQNFVTINFDNTYYDFQTEEKFREGSISDFYGIDKAPLFVKQGSIVPLAILNKQEDYEVMIYPGCSNEFILHYDEYVVNSEVHHAYTTFKLEYEYNKMVFNINPHLIDELKPVVFHLNFINMKKDSIVVVKGSEHKIEYNNEKKYLLIDIMDTNSEVSIEITNINGVELNRSDDYLDSKLVDYFETFDLDKEEKTIYKYKVRPYLHEDLESITNRIDKHIKFINKKQKKNLYKMISMYKK